MLPIHVHACLPSLCEVYLEKYKIILVENQIPNQFWITNNIEGQTKDILKTHIQKPNPIALPFKMFGHQ